MPPAEVKSLVQEIVDRITVAADRIEIQLSRAKIAGNAFGRIAGAAQAAAWLLAR